MEVSSRSKGTIQNKKPRNTNQELQNAFQEPRNLDQRPQNLGQEPWNLDGSQPQNPIKSRRIQIKAIHLVKSWIFKPGEAKRSLKGVGVTINISASTAEDQSQHLVI
ncbi:Hypothetical protein NTJ_13763 [Nesidiocoris tenuis]|uniref:Uncharacterized protein n=1 Tax=Nesidiocoris tenuis TaxID=355587 RepID=A0ABN7B985_9HEMI|nr:Hypothetical protein NTJ_13763 [Nesidiocoris tenuis]